MIPTEVGRRARIGLVLALGALLLAAAFAIPAQAATTVFSDGFESGNAWTYYTNGTGGSQTLVSSPVHSGVAALQGVATADPSQSELGIAHIRAVSFTEDRSQLSFWYHADGTVTYRSLVVEVHTASGANYFTDLPGAVTTGAWTKATIALTDVSSQLAGASVDRIVIKAVADSASGDASFTIDDVEILNGVEAPPVVRLTAPVPGAANVPTNRVLVAYFNTQLDPASVDSASAQIHAGGDVVPAEVRYLAGQQAVAVIPDGPLPPDATVDVTVSGVRSAAGGTLDTPYTWSFTTGSGAGAHEVVFKDHFANADGWRFYSNAASASSAIVTDPVHSAGGALQGSASDAGAPFVVSHIRDAHWLDEGGRLSFWYRVDGDATPKQVIVAISTAAGFTRYTALDTDSVPVGQWRHDSIALADIDPNLVGQEITSVELKLETATPGSIRFTIDDVAVKQSLAAYADLPSTDPAQGPRPSAATTARVRQLADQILRSQQPDGSLVVGPIGDPWSSKVDPYAANYAALGLLDAFALTRDHTYLSGATRWLDWYQGHMHADGVVDDCRGTYPNCLDTGDFDSVDSYASTYLIDVLKRQAVIESPERRQRYLDAVRPYVLKAAHALDTVYLEDGTTIAKQSYPVRFAMDNAETYTGLVAEHALARLLGEHGLAKLAARLAARTDYALRERYPVRPDGHFSIAVHPNGVQEGPLNVWFPDALASVLPLSHIGTPADAPLYHALVQQFDVGQAANRPTAINDTPQYMWWAQAALRVGDTAAAEHFVEEYDSIEGTANPATLAITAGHLIRVLTYEWEGSLWF